MWPLDRLVNLDFPQLVRTYPTATFGMLIIGLIWTFAATAVMRRLR